MFTLKLLGRSTRLVWYQMKKHALIRQLLILGFFSIHLVDYWLAFFHRCCNIYSTGFVLWKSSNNTRKTTWNQSLAQVSIIHRSFQGWGCRVFWRRCSFFQQETKSVSRSFCWMFHALWFPSQRNECRKVWGLLCLRKHLQCSHQELIG